MVGGYDNLVLLLYVVDDVPAENTCYWLVSIGGSRWYMDPGSVVDSKPNIWCIENLCKLWRL
jgi:hypothetical protein